MPKISLLKGERLIAEIKANKVLYDSSHKRYSDLALKTRVWGQVAAKCGVRTAHEAKSMWKNLRDCYRICRSKLNSNPESRMWRFYKHMEFIAPYIKHRKIVHDSTLDNSSVMHVTKEIDDKPATEMPLDISDSGPGFTTVYFWDDNDKKQSKDVPVTSNEPELVEEQEHEIESRLHSPFETDSYHDVLPEELQQGGRENSLKMFFDAMYASTSGLPLSLQRTVKRKVFSAVLEAEEEAEQLRESPPTVSRVKSEP